MDKITRFTAAAVAGSVLALGGAGVAAASTDTSIPPTDAATEAAVPGATSSTDPTVTTTSSTIVPEIAAPAIVAATDPDALAQQIQQLRDQVAKSAAGADAEGTRSSVDQLSTVLGDLSTRKDSAIGFNVRQQATNAHELATRTSGALAEVPRQAPITPPAAPTLNPISDLVATLLALVNNLVHDLLGDPWPSFPIAGPPAGWTLGSPGSFLMG